MKKIIAIATLGISTLGFSQVIIGNDVGTVPANQKTSVLLEFAQGNKGLVLPTVRQKPSNPTPGTIILDASTSGTTARIKYYNGVGPENGWVDLSGKDGDASSLLSTQPSITDVPEANDAKAIIGASSSAANGVLVLESATKAMVLPQVADVNDIPQPTAGMMVYVNKTGAKRLAVFNGTYWSFWKP